jgi:transposase InsO family protein
MQHRTVCSMTRRGDCWDNAVAESFFATLKVEFVHDAAWTTRSATRAELFEYLESPRAFEQQRAHATLAT